jgi:S1-C subfamily serine protease
MAQGICFAVPSKTAQRIVSVLIREGRVVRSFLGISGETWPIHRRVNRYYQLENESAVRVVHVDPNGPSQSAGLRKDDILISLANHSMKGVDDLQHFLTDWPVGIPVEAQVLRGTELKKLTIIPTELKS